MCRKKLRAIRERIESSEPLLLHAPWNYKWSCGRSFSFWFVSVAVFPFIKLLVYYYLYCSNISAVCQFLTPLISCSVCVLLWSTVICFFIVWSHKNCQTAAVSSGLQDSFTALILTHYRLILLLLIWNCLLHSLILILCLAARWYFLSDKNCYPVNVNQPEMKSVSC